MIRVGSGAIVADCVVGARIGVRKADARRRLQKQHVRDVRPPPRIHGEGAIRCGPERAKLYDNNSTAHG